MEDVDGDLKYGIFFHILNHVLILYGRYPESIIKNRHDLASKGKVGDEVIFDIINHVGK